jgi:peroxiredoxin
LGVLNWRIDQLEATTPKRLGRDGLKPGKRAPDLTLPSAAGHDVSLHDFAGRKVLLVFTQSGCSPCKAVIPELNRLERGDTQVVVVNNGDAATTQKWSDEVGARFPVLTQDKFRVSKKYEVFATPFAFLLDAKGVIVSKGIINNWRHIHYVLSGTRLSEPGALATGDNENSNGHVEAEPDDSVEGKSAGKASLSPSAEVSHVLSESATWPREWRLTFPAGRSWAALVRAPWLWRRPSEACLPSLGGRGRQARGVAYASP